MNIRDIEQTDIEAIAALHVRSWRAAYHDILPEPKASGPTLERRIEGWRMEQSSSDRLLVEDESGIHGFIAVGPSRESDTNPKDVAELYAIYLDPSAWGKGMSHALWKAAKKRLQSSQYRKVVLEVYEDNQRARRFYESIGFRLDPLVRVEHRISGKSIYAVRYQMDIEPSDFNHHANG